MPTIGDSANRLGAALSRISACAQLRLPHRAHGHSQGDEFNARSLRLPRAWTNAGSRDILIRMRQIGAVMTQPSAQRLVDILLTNQIKSQVDPAEGGWTVWVHDEDRVAVARALLERFTANPDAPEFVDAERSAARLRAETAARDQASQKRVVDVRAGWDASQRAGKPVTILLIVISVVVAAMTQFGDDDQTGSLRQALNFVSYNPVTRQYNTLRNPESDLRRGQFWRLVTPIFLHFSVMHIVFNSMSLWSVGGVLETRFGTRRLLLLTLAIAVPSNAAEYLWTGPTFGGLSGVVFGLFGYLWMLSRFDRSSGIYLSPGSVTWMLFFLVLCMSGAIGSIANAAHLVGLLAGMLLGIVPIAWRRLTRGSP